MIGRSGMRSLIWPETLAGMLAGSNEKSRSSKALPTAPSGCPGTRLTGIGELRVGVRELSVLQARGERERTLGVLRNPDAVVRHVRGARRNQPDVEQAARLPRVALVDGIAVRIELIRAIEVRAGSTGPRPSSVTSPLQKIVRPSASWPMQLEPDVERVHRAAREEMSDLARAHHDVEPHRRSGRQDRRGAIERRRQFADFTDHDRRVLLRLFADREARHRLGRRRPARRTIGVPLGLLRRPARPRRCRPTRSLR